MESLRSLRMGPLVNRRKMRAKLQDDQVPKLDIERIPEGWATASLGALCRLVNGRAFKPSEWKTSGLPIIRIQNLNDSRAKFNYYSGPIDSRHRVENGELLFAWSGTPGTSFGAHIWKGEPAVLNQHIFRVIFPESLLDKNYLRLAINERLNDLIHAAHGGAGLAHVTKGVVEATELLVAPLAEQKRIVQALEALLEKVESSRSRLGGLPRVLGRFRQAVLAAACDGRLTEDWRAANPSADSGKDVLRKVSAERSMSQESGVASRRRNTKKARTDYEPENLDDLPELPEFPERWGLATVGFVAEVMQYGTSTKAEASRGDGVPVLRMGNIQDGRLDLSNLKFIDRRKEDPTPYLLRQGDLLFNRTNSPELVGKCAVFGLNGEYVFASYLIRVRCDSGILLGDFLSAWINSPWGRAWARQVRTDGVSQSNINTVSLGAMPIPVPSIEEQQEIIRLLEALQSRGDLIEKKMQSASRHCERLGEAVLARAFRGELVHTEAELADLDGRSFEPASELVARVAGDRSVRESTRISKSDAAAGVQTRTKRAPARRGGRVVNAARGTS
jgi:type I restriction enzyme S subunit